MRSFAVFLLLCLCFTVLVPIQAQETPQSPPVNVTSGPPPDELGRIQAEATRIAIDIERSVTRAESQADLAFNLLGIFEAIGFLVTMLVGVGGAFGAFQLFSARSDIQKVREDLINEAQELRNRFDEEIQRHETQLRQLEKDLLEQARSQTHATSQALLANAMLPLGERQYRAGDYVGTLNTYARALELDPHNPVVHQRIGYVHTQKGDLDRAREHYERAIEREPNFAPALAGLGFVYRRLGEVLEKSFVNNDQLQPAAKTEKQIERDALFNKGEGLLLQALKISPRLVDDDGESWWGVLGGLYKRRGQIDQAIEAYKQVTEVTPESSYGFGNLALLYMKKNERDLMLKTYERVERIAAAEAAAESGNFWGYADLTVARFALGKSQQARESLPMAMTLAPLDSPYMLRGLQETLSDLMSVVQEERRPAIQTAIQDISATLSEREATRRGV